MSQRKPPIVLARVPALARIDRNIALSFGALVSVLMVTVLVGGAFYYQWLLEREENQLTAMVSEVLTDSINRTSFSGKYHTRLLVEEIAATQPRIAYAMIVDADGRVVAHSDAARNDARLDDPGMAAAAQILAGAERVIQDLEYRGERVKEVMLPFRTGYMAELAGVVRVGVSTEQTEAAFAQGLLYLAGMVAALLLVSMVLIYRLSRTFGSPVKQMAWQLQGILDYAPMLISIRDREGHLHEASASFRRAFGLDSGAEAETTWDELAPRALVDAAQADDAAVFERGEVTEGEVRLEMSGAERVFMLTKFPIARDERGGVLLICAIAQDVTERVAAEEALRGSQKRLADLAGERELLLEHASDFVYRHDRGGVMSYVSPAVELISGYAPEQWRVHYSAYFTDSPLNTRAAQYTEEALRTGAAQPPYLVEVRHRDGHPITLEVNERPFFEDGRVAGLIGVARDVSERRRFEEQLFREKELAQVTLQSIGDGVITTDATGRISYMNPTAERLTGWAAEDAAGSTLLSVFRIADENDAPIPEEPFQRVLCDGEITAMGGDSALLARDGTRRAIESSAAPIRDRAGHIVGAVLVFHDVSATREMARKIAHQATHDALTGLLNRSEFERRLEEALRGVEADDGGHALLYLDLDQFKLVNDTSGHLAGDTLLRQLGEVLRRQVRQHDTVARLGGDEFGVLLEDCPLEQAHAVAHELLDAVSELRFTWGRNTFGVGASIGLVMLNRRAGHDRTSALIAADTACYAAKDAGRNRVQVYHPEDAELAERHGQMDWVARINRAFDEERFRLFHQAITPIDRDRPGTHWEILLRMVDEKGRLIPPGAFIPAAERYNLMPALDRWVIQATFRACRRLRDEGRAPTTVAINLSGASLGDERLLAFIRAQFAETALAPELFCFEITETAAIANFGRATELIDALRAMGCAFALDDFGSGLSSFGYLKNLQVDFIKIDGSFVRDIVDDPLDLAVVQAITRIGEFLGVQTIAEFVENDAILERLRHLGVDYAQGYGIHRPEPLPEPASASTPTAS